MTVSESATGNAKLGALQQRTQVPHVREWRYARAGATFDLLFGRQQAVLQFAERGSAEQGRPGAGRRL